jgi:hypothetical protein
LAFLGVAKKEKERKINSSFQVAQESTNSCDLAPPGDANVGNIKGWILFYLSTAFLTHTHTHIVEETKTKTKTTAAAALASLE